MADELPSSRLRELQRSARRIPSDGALWLVYELMASPYDRRQSPCLIFESDAVVRRVRDYPTNWRELSDDDLLALSWAR
jgi:hypothetical protein